MNIYYSDAFLRQIKKKYTKNPSLRKKVVKQVKLFKRDTNFPSLKTHKLTGKRSDQYAFWIEANLRIIFIYSGQDIIFTDIVTHDQY